MRRLVILGGAALTTFALLGTSCSSSNSTTGSGGSAATTGGSTSTAGSPGTGGSGPASTGTGGNTPTGTGGATSTGTTGGATSAAGSTALGCTSTNTDVAATGALIADFAGDAGIEIKGGTSTYGGTAAPTISTSGGALTITENAAATTSPQYVGAVLYFNNCVDAHTSAGVQFTISGTVSAGCTVQYSTNYTAADAAATDPKGSCTLASCYSPQKTLTIPATATQMQIAWADTGTAGSPVGAVDPTTLTSIQWQFTIAAGTGTCTANLSITNVKFF